MRDRIDTDRLRDQFPLNELAAQDTKLTFASGEWKGCCPIHSESRPSFTIYQKAGYQRFHCFSCGAKGDVLDYVIQTGRAHDMPSAARYLDGDLDSRAAAPAAPREREIPPDPYEGITMLPQPGLFAGDKIQVFNPKSGKTFGMTPTHVHLYVSDQGEPLGYVVRWYVDGKKQTPFISWSRRLDGSEGWTMSKLPQPAPIYAMERAGPKDQLFVFEGEKKPDMFNALGVKGLAGIGFPYGASSWNKADWSRLAGRHVVLWPDCDFASEKAMLGNAGKDDAEGLAGHLMDLGAASVKYVRRNNGEVKKGWNVDDLIDAGGDADAVIQHIREHIELATRRTKPTLVRSEPPPPVQEMRQIDNVVPLHADRDDAIDMAPLDEVAEAAEYKVDKKPSVRRWMRNIKRGTDERNPGPLKTSKFNHMLFLKWYPDYWHAFAWNDHAKQVWWDRRPKWDEGPFKPRRVTQADLTQISIHMDQIGLTADNDRIMQLLIAMSPKHRIIHPVRDALDALQWDGTPRLDTVLIRHLGVADTRFNRMIARMWMIGACARIRQPGCQMDTALVLEGPQGLRKSFFFRTLSKVLTDDGFTDDVKDLANKDTIQGTIGKVIIEMAEMDALNRNGTSHLKAWLTRREDQIRLPYAAEFEVFPRQFVIGGTINPVGSGWMKDPSGNRRFWPARCTKRLVDEEFEKEAAQIWAEADVAYKAGEKWWMEGEDEAKAIAVQSQRREEHSWTRGIEKWTKEWDKINPGKGFEIVDVITLHLEIPKGQQKHSDTTTVANILHGIGYTSKQERQPDGRRAYIWRKA